MIMMMMLMMTMTNFHDHLVGCLAGQSLGYNSFGRSTTCAARFRPEPAAGSQLPCHARPIQTHRAYLASGACTLLRLSCALALDRMAKAKADWDPSNPIMPISLPTIPFDSQLRDHSALHRACTEASTANHSRQRSVTSYRSARLEGPRILTVTAVLPLSASTKNKFFFSLFFFSLSLFARARIFFTWDGNDDSAPGPSLCRTD
ncbi:hypothetical protein F4780DRAFT_121136 [Xylariomycetidae sp. FL0641]|nr:hypothetical protein F4780DRAFT_121136 [Xylariomycetidae sp. FL0641]